jgi:hypothetical protein
MCAFLIPALIGLGIAGAASSGGGYSESDCYSGCNQSCYEQSACQYNAAGYTYSYQAPSYQAPVRRARHAEVRTHSKSRVAATKQTSKHQTKTYAEETSHKKMRS